jgi:hypothetical protein
MEVIILLLEILVLFLETKIIFSVSILLSVEIQTALLVMEQLYQVIAIQLLEI